MSDILSDVGEVPDSVYVAALDHAVTPSECAFRDVLVFHRDILNGGIAQALWNYRVDCSRYTTAYEKVGMKTLAAFLDFARRSFPTTGADYGEMLSDGDLDALTGVYVAAIYNLPYACAENRDDPDFPLDGDWVERMALRFARANQNQFSSIVAAAEAEI